ncbi:hypothetical protein ACRAWG_15405 [Methylobacterium sp. P31]
MKRRSARPFTVEVKQTRTSRASLHEATARSRKGHELWRGLPLLGDDEPAKTQPVQTSSATRAEPAQPDAPARRVLPSLVPTFSMPVEPDVPEVREVSAVERLPRVRRVKPPAEPAQKPPTRTSAKRGQSAEPTVQPQLTPAAVAVPVATSIVTAQPAVPQARATRRGQQAETLRPGERWKRRLPRVLW